MPPMTPAPPRRMFRDLLNDLIVFCDRMQPTGTVANDGRGPEKAPIVGVDAWSWDQLGRLASKTIDGDHELAADVNWITVEEGETTEVMNLHLHDRELTAILDPQLKMRYTFAPLRIS